LPQLLAAAGKVTDVFATPLGGITVCLDVVAGSLAEPSIVIKNIDPDLLAEARELAIGDEAAVTGLIADDQGSGYFVNSTGVLTATH